MYHIVMEACWGGELYDHIVHTARENPTLSRGLPEAEVSNRGIGPADRLDTADYSAGANTMMWVKWQVSSLMRQVLEALAFIHARHIVHRDVKAENFLFVDKHDKSRLKLCDFGAAVNLRTTVKGLAEGRVGTLSYAAPEM